MLVILICAILYLFGSLAEQLFFSFNKSSDVTPVYLQLSTNELVVTNENERHNPRGERGGVVAKYAPFFFQGIPVNYADKELLMTVKGIGPVMADSIILYRQNYGPFTGVDDLSKIPGVGPKRASRLASYLIFDGVP